MVAGALLAAGCGNASSSSTDPSQGASAMPSSTLFYADVNLDQGSSAWKQFTAVGQRFPGWQELAGKVVKSLNSTGRTSGPLTFKDDVQPWLGGSAAIGVTSFDPSGGNAHYVAFVASSDDGKAKDAVAKEAKADGDYSGYALYADKQSTSEAAVGDGAVLVSDDTQTLHDAIDARTGKADSLASDDGFSSAMAKLPADSLVRGYVSTQKLAELAGMAALGGAGGSSTAAQTQALAKTLDSIDSLSFAAWANGNGYRLTVRSTLEQGADQSPLATAPSSLTGLVPGDAFAFLAFGDYGSYLKQGLQSGTPGLGQELNLLKQQTGISVQHDLLPLLSGDGLFYTAPGVPVRAALVLKPDDPHAAALTMHKIMMLVAQGQPGARVTPLASGTGEQVAIGGLTLSWRLTDGGLIAIGNDPAAGTAPSSPLASSPAYATLLNQAEVPDGANVPLYVNLSDALKLFPVSVDPNLAHVGGVLAWSSRNGQDTSADLFIQVK
ncbi:MAG TPA: DUF3352 domain-containing protein [Gaiellales bacterium]|nr:DUF3352 domain-containing protein [Gaiellales bacterium]